MKKLALFLAIVSAVFSCKKTEDRSCWKFRGDDSTLEIPIDNTDRFVLRSKLNFIFIQDSLNKIVLKGGKNMLNLVKITTDQDGVVEISNENKCGFLRKHGSWVDVEIHVTNLRNVMFTGSNTITGSVKSDYLTLVINHGAGTIDMDVEAIAVTAKALEGFGNFTLRGHASVADLSVTQNAYCDTYGLLVDDSLKLISNSATYMHVNASGVPVTGNLLGTGNIFYIGDPQSIDMIKTGSGSLYKAD